MIDLFFKGGPLMYPLLLCSVISLAVIIEKGVIYLSSKTKRGIVDEAVDLLKRGEVERVLERLSGMTGPVCAIITEAVQNRDSNRDALEGRISQAGSAELKRLTGHLHYLELIGKVAPMIGLSGTVLGLARTFQTVAATRGFADANLLAGGIWEALITTVAGLFIAIPALIFYHLYDNGIRSLAHEMSMAGEDIIKALEGIRG
jgi:biopolymer transport protein ExbB